MSNDNLVSKCINWLVQKDINGKTVFNNELFETVLEKLLETGIDINGNHKFILLREVRRITYKDSILNYMLKLSSDKYDVDIAHVVSVLHKYGANIPNNILFNEKICDNKLPTEMFLSLVRFLVSIGINLNQTNNSGHTFITESFITKNFRCWRSPATILLILNECIKLGYDIHQLIDGKTHYFYIPSYNDLDLKEIYQALFDNGVNVHHCDDNGNNYIMNISSFRKFLFEQALEFGVDINTRNNDGDTLLHLFTKRIVSADSSDDSSDVCEEVIPIKWLLENKADTTIRNKDGHTGIQLIGYRVGEEYTYARQYDEYDTCTGYEPESEIFTGNQLINEIKHKMIQEATCYLDRRFELVKVYAQYGCVDMQQNADLLLNCIEFFEQYHERVEELMGYGFDVRYLVRGGTLLHVMVQKFGKVKDFERYVEVLRLLLNAGIDVEAKDEHGMTAIEYLPYYVSKEVEEEVESPYQRFLQQRKYAQYYLPQRLEVVKAFAEKGVLHKPQVDALMHSLCIDVFTNKELIGELHVITTKID